MLRFETPLVCVAPFVCVVFSICVFSVDNAEAQDLGRSISVSATGSSVDQPDQLEITVSLTQSGKTLVEAGELFKGKRSKLADALNPMEFPDLVIKSDGKKIVQGNGGNDIGIAVMMGDEPVAPDSSFAIKEKLTILIPSDTADIVQVAQMTAQIEEQVIKFGGRLGEDNNPYTLTMGGGVSVAKATLIDSSSAELAAWKDALKKAKSKAEKLAAISGLKLGKIISVKEDQPTDFTPQVYFGMMGGIQSIVGKVETQRSLVVEFEAK